MLIQATSVTDPVNNITKEREVKMMEAVVTMVWSIYVSQVLFLPRGGRAGPCAFMGRAGYKVELISLVEKLE